jgi:hypothetical protein
MFPDSKAIIYHEWVDVHAAKALLDATKRNATSNTA